MGRTVALNRKARHDYTIEDTLEAGIVLTGTEIKSDPGRQREPPGCLRHDRARRGVAGGRPHRSLGGGQSLQPRAAARPQAASPPRPDRSSLGKTRAKGLTLVPLSIYMTDRGQAKVQLGLARGKQQHDRRRDIADRDARRDLEREMADIHRGR